MSAILTKKESNLEKNINHFIQKIPIQSYLIAIAIGDLEFRNVGPRSKVWAEKEIIDAAEYEFAETENQLKTAEEICGPYVWEIYDLLILPPSFPFGGMENPCLTFVTPTLLAGDRSLANVVAHEVAHSWTGNLITNKNFEHFWLNEGFTVFIERKIVSKMLGMKVQDFQAWKGLDNLKETINQLGESNQLTALVINLKNEIHPDDAFSSVPYEKGYIFLRYLENIIGSSEKFECFLRDYFENYKYKSLTTEEFKLYFENYFKNNKCIKDIDWNTWLYAPGMPPKIIDYDTTLRSECEKIKENIINSTLVKSSCQNLSSIQIEYILQQLYNYEPLSCIKTKLLEETFNLNCTKNSEIKFWWFRICIKARRTDIIEPALKWITEVGRMKFVRPLYRDLYNWETSRTKAVETYLANRQKMMHVAAYTVSKDLHLNK